jgi:hypothetical protein
MSKIIPQLEAHGVRVVGIGMSLTFLSNRKNSANINQPWLGVIDGDVMMCRYRESRLGRFSKGWILERRALH